ncbi:hypothetical protein FG05_35246 [Fusarium graminearum]|nr:hypothetical protein FG05_35246 [Fusarium graminearum]
MTTSYDIHQYVGLGPVA